jgi:hypothetical protein
MIQMLEGIQNTKFCILMSLPGLILCKFSAIRRKEIKKTTRYTFIPDHLQGKVSLLKCDSALCPDPRSIGAGAGKADQAEAIKNIQKRKAEALAKQADADDEDENGNTREHLEPKTKRVKTEDGSREKLTEAMMSFIDFKKDNAAAYAAKGKVDQLNTQLQLYMGFLANPMLTPTMRNNYKAMITQIQKELMSLMEPEEPLRRSPRATPTKSTPPTRTPNAPARSRLSSSWQSTISSMSSRMTHEERDVNRSSVDDLLND